MYLPRLAYLSCLLGIYLLPLLPARAASSSTGQIDVNFFYDTLKDEGSWFNTTEYGDVWQPYIAYKSDSWRPYTDGYWSYTDGGWMFVSDESFGWAVYHYGRWTKLEDIGWAWVPGTEWAPAWVTWRESKPEDGAGTPGTAAVSATTTDVPDDKGAPPPPPPADNSGPSSPAAGGGNYIGWAPLPPAPIVYGTGYSYGPGVDVEFGIDPYAYVFTDFRSFGDPWLAGVIFGPDRGYYCCDHSVNVTNVYYDRRGGYRGFYNGGPSYYHLRGVTARPIPQLSIQRNTNSALAREQVRNGTFNRVSGSRINVAAPRFSQNSVRNGRVTFSRRGTLPVTPVSKQFAPASAAENPGYKQARESFNRQGEAYRAQLGNVPGGAAIASLPHAPQEERQGRPGSDAVKAGKSGSGARHHKTAASSEKGRHEGSRHRGSSRGTSVGGREPGARHERSSAGPRVERGRGGGGHHESGSGGEKKKK